MEERPDDTLALAEKLELARTAVREFHAQCFWYMRADLNIKPSDLKEIARGLINYNASETARILRTPSAQIEAKLGYVDEPELIHRDNLVLL